MEDENFYELISKQIDETEDKLSALDKILRAFDQKAKKMKEEQTTNNNYTNNQKKENL